MAANIGPQTLACKNVARRYWPTNIGPQIWPANIGQQILARKHWPANVGPQILARKCWPANIGPQILASKFWPANFGPQKFGPQKFGPQILARKFWPAKIGPQKCGPQILARKNVARSPQNSSSPFLSNMSSISSFKIWHQVDLWPQMTLKQFEGTGMCCAQVTHLRLTSSRFYLLCVKMNNFVAHLMVPSREGDSIF